MKLVAAILGAMKLRLRAMNLGWWLMGTDLKRRTKRWDMGVALFEWGSYYR